MKVESGDRDGAGYSHHNMGEVHLEKGAHLEALAAFREAEREWAAIGNTRARAAAVRSEGQAFEGLGRHEEALERYRRSLAMRRDSFNPRGEADTLGSLGGLLLRLRRHGEAADAYRTAVSISERLGQKSLSADLLGGLATAEEARGNTRAAGTARAAEVVLLKRLRNEEQGRARGDMRAALAAHEMRSHAERLERDAVLRTEDLRRRRAERNFALGGAASLMAVALFALAGYRNKRSSETRLRAQAARLEEALAQVKTLRGLLPLCAWCRKVRNDDGYWKDLADHVEEHTEAAITHGICPECRASQFPAVERT
jgi:tetratricopeptide (TPR) repeat protein